MFSLTTYSFLQIFRKTLCVVVISVCSAICVIGQQADNNSVLGPNRDDSEQPRSVKDFLAKQRAEKAKKEHEELLQRGDELLQLTGQLETAYEQNKNLTSADRNKLVTVEKLAEKIRKSMGGDDDDDKAESVVKNEPVEDVADAVVNLKEMAVKLVDELKRTSRFGISAVAIQTSNSVLKLARFLRLKR